MIMIAMIVNGDRRLCIHALVLSGIDAYVLIADAS